MITVNVTYTPMSSNAFKLRTFVCQCQISDDYTANPLKEFNKLLDIVAQEAFDDGRMFERKHPQKEIN